MKQVVCREIILKKLPETHPVQNQVAKADIPYLDNHSGDKVVQGRSPVRHNLRSPEESALQRRGS